MSRLTVAVRFVLILLSLVVGMQPSRAETKALRSTVCTSNADCPTGQLCCYPCGIDGCDRICMTPVKKRCPLFV